MKVGQFKGLIEQSIFPVSSINIIISVSQTRISIYKSSENFFTPFLSYATPKQAFSVLPGYLINYFFSKSIIIFESYTSPANPHTTLSEILVSFLCWLVRILNVGFLSL